MKVTMTKVKETKNTFVYQADTTESDEILSTVYINKTAFKGQNPPHLITVEITEGQAS